MACGTPVIAWRCGSVPEIVEDGVTGFIVATEDEAVAAVARLHADRPPADPRRVRAALHRHGHGPQLPAALLAAVRRPRAVGRGASPARAGRLNVAASRRADRATASRRRRAQRLFALKDGDTFVVGRRLRRHPGDGDGLFHDDTRILSRFRLSSAGQPPSLLGAAVGQDNVLFTSHLTNRPLPPLGGQSTPDGVIHIERTRLLWRTAAVRADAPASTTAATRRWLPLVLEFAADFRDMFEVRGAAPPRAADTSCRPSSTGDAVTLRYEGLDGVARDLRHRLLPAPASLTAQARRVHVPSAARRPRPSIYVEVGLERGATALPRALPHRRRPGALRHARIAAPRRHRQQLRPAVQRVARQVARRPGALTTELRDRPLSLCRHPLVLDRLRPRRDHHRLQMLWLDPTLARGVLRFLAAHQATETSRFRDAAPGKIMHETRKGEMARARRAAVRPLLRRRRHHAAVRRAGRRLRRAHRRPRPDRRAVAGAAGGHGLDRGRRRLPTATASSTMPARRETRPGQPGLEGQPGFGLPRRRQLRRGPDRAGRGAGLRLRRLPGHGRSRPAARRARARATAGRRKAEQLRAAVEARFWMEELGTYAIALDGDGQPCRVRASNPGPPAVRRPAGAGAGRAGRGPAPGSPASTPAGASARWRAGEPRYNPMSYHNGSVWPHDTALCAAGMARYGERDGVARLLSDMFEAAVKFDMRLPELFCGFARRPASRRSPIRSPACRRPGRRARCS